MAVQVPTEEQLRAGRGRRWACRSPTRDVDVLHRPHAARASPPTTWSTRMPDNLPRGEVSAHAGLSADRRGEQAQCLVRQDHGRRRRRRQAQGQDGRAEGQHHAGRRADDERRVDARGLHARDRRDGRAAHPRCRRHDRRQGALRVLLPLGRQPHQRDRAGAQSATRWATRPAAPRRAAPCWWRWAKSTWRSAATRAARSACRRRSAASTA